MKEFYVVLVTIALINCISLSRITGPGFWLTRPRGGLTRPSGGFTSPGDPGTAVLFAACAAVLLVANTLFTGSVMTIAAYISDLAVTPWLIVILSITGAGLLLLPISGWIQRYALSGHNMRRLLPLLAVETMILTSLLFLVGPDTALWAALRWSLCAAAASIFMIAAFAGLRLRLSVSDAPTAWRGLPLELVTAGILALALLSPAGAMP